MTGPDAVPVAPANFPVPPVNVKSAWISPKGSCWNVATHEAARTTGGVVID